MGPIDLVYTWVNPHGTQLDEERIRLRKLLTGEDQDYRAGDARSRDNGEILYSISASLEYMPFIRHIIIFGAGGRPSWLSSDTERIKFVAQETIIPAEVGLTFSSDVVESFIYKITGLSERYIYSNDDFFVSSLHTENDFYNSDGRCLIPVSDRLASLGDLTFTFRQMEINAVRALKRHTGLPKVIWKAGYGVRQKLKETYEAARNGVAPVNTINHVAFPCLRSEWNIFHDLFAAELRGLFSSPFRSGAGFAVNLAYCHFLSARGLAELSLAPKHGYLDRRQTPQEWLEFQAFARRGEFTRFCLNDTPTTADDGWENYLDGLFEGKKLSVP